VSRKAPGQRRRSRRHADHLIGALNGCDDAAVTFSERGWTSSRGVLTQIWLLEWIDDSSRDGYLPSITDFQSVRPVTEDDLADAAGALETAGLIEVHAGMGGLSSSSARTTGLGHLEVMRLREGRADQRRRRVAVRDALLDWFYEQKNSGAHFPVLDDFAGSTRAHLDGETFTKSEIDAAAERRKAWDYIKALGSWGSPVDRAEIASPGADVVEDFDGSITAAKAAATRGPTIVTHFNGPVTGMVGIGEVTQTQNAGMDLPGLAKLLDDVRMQAQALPAGDQAIALTFADTIEAEFTAADPDPGIVQKMFQRLQAVAHLVGNDGFTGAVEAAVAFYLASKFGSGG
jgi:hypothetical protein